MTLSTTLRMFGENLGELIRLLVCKPAQGGTSGNGEASILGHDANLTWRAQSMRGAPCPCSGASWGIRGVNHTSADYETRKAEN